MIAGIEQIAELLQSMQDDPLWASQYGISAPKIQANLILLSAGSKPPPIYIKDGIIIEGHHRYIAGKLFGELPDMIKDYPANNSRKIGWPDLFVDPDDWDNPVPKA